MNAQKNEHCLIIGAPGAGKHLFATQQLVNNLAAGRAATVFDCGRSYVGIAKALGGTVVTVKANHGTAIEHFGNLPLTIFEFEDVTSALDIDRLCANMPDLAAANFILVDAMAQVNQRVPGLWAWLEDAAADSELHFCGVLQTLHGTDLTGMPDDTPVLRIENFAVAESSFLRDTQLFRHQDGGIYRAHGVALHTDNKAPLVVYEHLWPFEAGQLWARPEHEWAGRFTPISEEALLEAQKQDRQAAQEAVTAAKAARRAAAAQ